MIEFARCWQSWAAAGFLVSLVAALLLGWQSWPFLLAGYSATVFASGWCSHRDVTIRRRLENSYRTAMAARHRHREEYRR
jgi:hypothetical protein